MTACDVIGCDDRVMVHAVLQNGAGALPYGAKLCQDHGSSDEGRNYTIISINRRECGALPCCGEHKTEKGCIFS